MIDTHTDEVGVLARWRAHRRSPNAPRVRHRASDAMAVMLFSAAVSGALGLCLSVLTWWATRSGELNR